MVRLSFCWLVGAGLLGALLLAGKGVPALLPAFGDAALHGELLLAGWLVQLALGVAYWIVPRVGGERPRSGLAVAGAALLNLGLLLALTGALAGSGGIPGGSAGLLPRPVAAFLARASAPAELVAVLLFGVHLALRVAARRPRPPAAERER